MAEKILIRGKGAFILALAITCLFNGSYQDRPCESGEFAMMLYGTRRCRPCSTIYANCNECSASNLNNGESFCSSCKFFHKTMGWSEEKSAYVASLKENDGFSHADSFGWECSFNWQLLIFTTIGVLVMIFLIVFNYIRKKKERERLEIKKRREKEKEYGRLV